MKILTWVIIISIIIGWAIVGPVLIGWWAIAVGIPLGMTLGVVGTLITEDM